MLEEPLPPPEQPAAEPAPAPVAPPPTRRRRHPVLRVLGLLVALVAAVLVATLTIDLGPALRKRAETAGSKYLERPMHIGGLKVELLTGTFEVDDLVIEGLQPTDRPFLKAKRILVNLPWWSILSRELVVEDVDMSDWEMVVEQFPNGRHNFPKIVHESKGPKGPKRFTTTVRSVIARRGQFTYEDHGTPWSTVARNLEVSVYKGLTRYQGTARFSNGPIKIQSVRAVPRRHADPLSHRRRSRAARAHRSHERRFIVGRRRVCRSRPLARDALQREVARGLSDREANLLQGHELHRRRLRRLHRDVPLLQGAVAS